ncbi:PREDICTED: uncharacterized protein LOC107164347 [Diuraphis noxia]|uniref:uncharacterized protein LOC107164347 n=1 Tax=Diuraphis noxia TaxID=143948 RepID=UPI0007637D0A|nr:PREDICTED: uncharacterized protein LOC107164347 [Diuraphis noxia]
MEDLHVIPNDKCRNVNESNLETKPGLLVINSYLNQINPDLKDVQTEITEKRANVLRVAKQREALQREHQKESMLVREQELISKQT